MASNYQNVLEQLRAHGLIIKDLVIGSMKRCKVDGNRENRGWYIIHELRKDNGDILLVGSYGIWQGQDNGAQKIDIDKEPLTQEQLAAIKARMADDKRRADLASKQRAEKAARKAEYDWRKNLTTEGHCDYLTRKSIPAIGVKFSKKNSMAVPMQDITGRVHGLQIILDREHSKDRIDKIGRDKEYYPVGLAKKGKFHLLGTPTNILLVGEGYATCASIHAATGLPIAVAFDAGNIDPVIEALKSRYRNTHLLICADNDSLGKCPNCQKPIDIAANLTACPHCEQEHKRKNTGVDAASLASLKHGCAWVVPNFSDENARFAHFSSNKGKLTDFNDLHIIDGLHTVRIQIEQAIAKQGWRISSTRVGDQTQGGGENTKQPLKPIESTDEVLDRFALVYGMGGMLFDGYEHMRVLLNDMKQACIHSDIPKRWQESKHRRIVRPDEVGFDPTGKNKEITCNTWSGWPTTPKEGRCDRQLELLEYMCLNEKKSRDVYQWVIRWLAYPLQHPGAKMKTCLVIHGPQGTGKNLFFDQILKIYGKYGRVIDQSAIEDKFNDCFSGKLFMLADEVVARSDLYHVKNKLKGLITGDRIRINPKNMSAYEETNHVNLVFLSNERMPVVIEQDDRRHQVIWTPNKLGPDFYEEVAYEIDHGGTEALHHYLVNLDLGDFNPHTKPIMTEAKHDLQELSKDSITRFYDEWTNKDIQGVEPIPALSEDIYILYTYWCRREGVRAAPKNKTIDAIAKRTGVRKERKRYLNDAVMVENPKTIIIPHNAPELHPGNSESGWLGMHIGEFQSAVNSYIGGSHA